MHDFMSQQTKTEVLAQLRRRYPDFRYWGWDKNSGVILPGFNGFDDKGRHYNGTPLNSFWLR